MSKQKVFTTLKVVVSISIIFIVLNSINLKEAQSTIKNANLYLLFLSILMPLLIILIITFKWDILLKTKNLRVSKWKLFRINIISHFWGLFLPSSLSIDIMRGYYLAKNGSGKKISASVIIIDRILGILSILTTAIIGLIFARSTFSEFNIYLYILVIFVPTITILAILFSNLPIKLLNLVSSEKYSDIFAKIKKTLLILNEFKQFPKALFYTYSLSVLVQLVRIINAFIISEAYSTGISITYFIVLVPIIMIIVMIPVSVGGIGVREGGFVAFFTLVGLSAEHGALISATSSLVMTIVALIGGIVFLFFKNEIKK